MVECSTARVDASALASTGCNAIFGDGCVETVASLRRQFVSLVDASGGDGG